MFKNAILIFFFFITTLCFAEKIDKITIISPVNNKNLKGKSLFIKSKILNYSIVKRIYVTAVLSYPGGSVEKISLSDNGIIDGDKPEDGVFCGSIENMRVPGDYSIKVKAWVNGFEIYSKPVKFTFMPEQSVTILEPKKYSTDNLHIISVIFFSLILLLIFIFLAKNKKENKKMDIQELAIPGIDNVSNEIRRLHTELEIITEAIQKNEKATPTETFIPDMENITKEIRRLRTELGIVSGVIQDNNEVINNHLSNIDTQKNQSANTGNIYDMRVELESMKNVVESWKEMAIEYFETLERGIEEYGVEDTRGKALLRDASIFARFCESRGLERINAQPGDILVEGFFQVIDEELTNVVQSGTIFICKEWGYRSGTNVYKRAKVILAKAINE